MKKTKNIFFGKAYQYLLIILALLIMFFSLDIRFMIISFLFYAIGGGYEYLAMNHFFAKQRRFKKNNLKESIKYGSLWVHFNIDCIKKYGTKLYYFRKLGSFPTFIAYLIMDLYVLIALILYINFSYYGLLIYLIPVITNIISFWRKGYFIL